MKATPFEQKVYDVLRAIYKKANCRHCWRINGRKFRQVGSLNNTRPSAAFRKEVELFLKECEIKHEVILDIGEDSDHNSYYAKMPVGQEAPSKTAQLALDDWYNRLIQTARDAKKKDKELAQTQKNAIDTIDRICKENKLCAYSLLRRTLSTVNKISNVKEHNHDFD